MLLPFFSSSLLLPSLELGDTQSLWALNTSPPRNRCTFLLPFGSIGRDGSWSQLEPFLRESVGAILLSRKNSVQLQGYLAHKKQPPPRTLQQDHAEGPMGVLGGRAFSYERGPSVPPNIRPPVVTCPLLFSVAPDRNNLRRTTSQKCEAVPRRARI